MKAGLIGNPQRGMSTVEILIAIAILTLTISATIMVVFGNQSLAIDTQTNVEALAKAESELEKARAIARADFFGVTDVPNTADDIYNKRLEVTDRSECQKEAVSTVTWQRGGRDLAVSLQTLFSDLDVALAMGGDCDTTPPGKWDNPQTAVSLGFGGDGATDIDVYDNRVYITSNPSAAGKDDLYIYDFDPVATTLTLRSKTTFGEGFNAIDVIKDQATGKLYAYALEDANTGQLRVIDVTNPASPTQVDAETFPNIIHTCSPASKPCLAGISVYAYDGMLYVGTNYIPNLALPDTQNNELHIYDLAAPNAPVWVGSENVNHNIYSIAARGDYVYVALSGTGESVRIYNVSDPVNPVQSGGFDPLGDEYSTALHLIGTKLYVGRERVNGNDERDFYILDVTDPEQDPTILGAKKLDLNPGSFIKGVVVKGDLAFVAIDNPTIAFKILDVSDPTAIKNHSVCTSLNFAENTSAIDMDDDHVFVANRSNDELRVIRDQPTACTP